MGGETSSAELDIVEYTKRSRKLLMIVNGLSMVSVLLCAIVPGAVFLNPHHFDDRAPADLNSTRLDSCIVGHALTFGEAKSPESNNFAALCPLFRHAFVIGWSIMVGVFVLLVAYTAWIFKIARFEAETRALARRCGHVLVCLIILGSLLYSFLTMILFPFIGGWAMCFWIPPYFALVFLDEGLDREKKSWHKREADLQRIEAEAKKN